MLLAPSHRFHVGPTLTSCREAPASALLMPEQVFVCMKPCKP